MNYNWCNKLVVGADAKLRQITLVLFFKVLDALPSYDDELDTVSLSLYPVKNVLNGGR